MKKLLTLTLLGLILSAASYALDPISGTMGCCVGNSTSLIDSSAITGGTWSSSNTGVATINSSSGYITGIAAGTATITFTLGASYVTAVFTVAPTPASITGPSAVCIGATIALSDATIGGTWASVGSGASVSSSGVVTGAIAGTTYIEYITAPGCYVFTPITIGGGVTVAAITGADTVCAGSTTALADATTGGVWTSSSTAIASVNASTGVVEGVSAGIAAVSYTVTGTCGSVSTFIDVFVTATGTAGTISGASSVGVGGITGYSSSVSGGTWSSSNTAVATVNAASGAVHGVSPGTATITYSVTSCGTLTTATAVVTVVALNRISGNINFSGGSIDSTSVIKVWLITYDPATHLLEAIDSTTTFSGGSSAYYQFIGEPTDSYRVKAAVYPVVFSSTGYMPTYHTSSSYWYSADVFYHTGGTDDGENINMAYGTVTAGAGFIAGDVTTGANKGTSTGVPAVGMQIYVLSSAGTILQYTYTDAAGHYSFSNLPLGTYTIYPEAINYATTAYTSINLTGGSSGMSTASFVQHLLSKTITPVTEGVNNVKSYASSVATFPNPASGKLNIQWQESVAEAGNVTIADITGKEMYKATINMNEGIGVSQLDLSGLTNGLYILTIKSGTINYNNKIQLQH